MPYTRAMLRRLVLCALLAPGLALGLSPGQAMARAARAPAAPAVPLPPLTPPAMCEAAIARAETDAKLPTRVLHSISLRESGRRDPETGRARPWPWTINYEGTGRYFASKAEAIAAVQEIQAIGGQSIDVGCMQVNLMHHPGAFATLEEAFDPPRNAAYAARFLRSLFASTGDWGTAIGGYHSRTPGKSEAYRDQVVATWNPTDPLVLARLSLKPAPPVSGPVAGLTMMYLPFAQPGPIQIGPNMAYRAFAPTTSAYRSFRPMNVAYAAFSRKQPVQRLRGRALDLRLNLGASGMGRGLVVPKGVIGPVNLKVEKPAVPRQAGQRSKVTG
ncbi:MAG: lytic transglycosylase domain-containing protein [Acetobacteraceae bacterium]|nr:lytic transglycosylase domain-containing protein [Acetobacteraceae bacterium]